MKINKIYIIGLIAFLGFSCKKSFLNDPSTTSPTADNYYTNATEVNGATGVLYNEVWVNWFDKAFTSVGDVLAGTVTGEQGDPNYDSFYNFAITGSDGLVSATWNSCYKAAGEASVLINVFQTKAGTVPDPAYLNVGIAEARFIRGFAYFYIARTFGDAPIVDNPVSLTLPGKANIPRYLQKDVLRYAAGELAYAEANLPAVSYQTGRVTKYSAAGLLAKVYLYEKDYADAAIEAKKVIDYANGPGAGLVGLNADCTGMFTSSAIANNNNIESLFSLRWSSAEGYNGGNVFDAYTGPSQIFTPAPTGATTYGEIIPSLDMLNTTTGYAPGDKRRGWSVMEEGYHNAAWVNANFPNGFTYDTTYTNGAVPSGSDPLKVFNGTRSSILKYDVGPNRPGEPVDASGAHTNMPTYILRYADVLLIYAEAILAGGASTSDAGALSAYNAVHNRAGLNSVTSFTEDDILHERKVEFAYEGDYWFDISRQGFAKAQQIIAGVERGTKASNGTVNSFKAQLTSASQLFLPIPNSETQQDPMLLQPAVPYYKN